MQKSYLLALATMVLVEIATMKLSNNDIVLSGIIGLATLFGILSLIEGIKEAVSQPSD